MIVLVLALFLSPSNWSQQQNPSDNDARETQNASEPTTAQSSTETNKQENRASANTPDEIPWWKDAGKATWVLVVVGVLGTIAAICTLRTIEKQTDVLINSERAWVMVEVEQMPGSGGIWDGQTMTREVRDLIAGNTTFTARIICKNDGKAPAWITEKHACLDIVDFLPKTPDWGRTQPIQIEPEPLSVGQIGKPKDEALLCKRPREKGKMVILYGIIKYRDTFGDNRTTSFGYKVRDDGVLERLPYPKYNENT